MSNRKNDKTRGSKSVENLIRKQRTNLIASSTDTKSIMTKENKINDSMKAITENSLTEDERNMHGIFHKYLDNTVKHDKSDETRNKLRDFRVENEDNVNLIKSYRDLLLIYTENELSYQIKSLEEGYNDAFQKILNINEEDMFKAILKKGLVVTDDDEIQDFIDKKKNIKVGTQFSRSGPRRR